MRLTVCLEGRVVGTLEGDGSRASFVYSKEWLGEAGAYPLSYSLPLGIQPFAGRAVLNFLWGLLPDNERVLATWGRWFQVSPRNPIALLAHVGEDCAGAVQFVTDDRLDHVLGPSDTRPPEVEWLSEQELAQRIRQLSKDGTFGRTEHEGQFSLAGAQSKTALYLDARRERWGVPRGRTPTTHILKPVSNDFAGFAENEHFCLSLARRVGLAAARTEWQRIGGVPTLIVERYDRVHVGSRWRRVHQEDVCQALGIHPDSKYESDGGPGFPAIMSLLNATDDPKSDRDRLMRGACFTYLIAATDVHAKNFSLLHGSGSSRPSMRLAPFYDIASAWAYPSRIPAQKIKLAMRIGRHYRLREILPRHFHRLALACHYSADDLLASLADLSARLPDEATALLKDATVPGMSRPILSALVDGLAAQCKTVQRSLARERA